MYRNKKEHFGLGFAQTSVLEAKKGQIPAEQGFVKKDLLSQLVGFEPTLPEGI
jgi:hypothetical protein